MIKLMNLLAEIKVNNPHITQKQINLLIVDLIKKQPEVNFNSYFKKTIIPIIQKYQIKDGDMMLLPKENRAALYKELKDLED